MSITKKKVGFYNRGVAKKQLQDLVHKTLYIYGCVKASQVVDRLRGIGFHYATLFGLSVGICDL